MMTFENFKNSAFEEALKLGCEAAEAYLTEDEAFSVNVHEGELDEYSVERKFGLNLRVKISGKEGSAYTEILDDPAALVLRAVDNAKASEREEETPMQGPCEYAVIEKKPLKALGMSPKEKIDFSMELEKKLMAKDERIMRSYFTGIQTSKKRTVLVNTLGLNAESVSETALAGVGPIMQENGEVKNGFGIAKGDKVFDTDAMINEGVEKTLEQFGASPVPSGEYRVLMRNEAMADMLMAFFPMFTADMAQKGMSLFKDSVGEKIAADCVSLIDDPFHEEGPRAFDAEGVPSVTKRVIDHGVLTTLLHNLKTAKKAGVASTSNAGRDASGPIGTAPSNLFIEAGEKTYGELIKELDGGLIITEVSGLHAGLNTVSGDFSLIAKGLLVENGSIVRSVDQITVAGNFIALMKSVECVGSDLRFGMPMIGNVGSPSVLINKLMIAGN